MQVCIFSTVSSFDIPSTGKTDILEQEGHLANQTRS